MGSDLYGEARNFRPRPNKVEWDGDELVILVDRFYSGYELLWRGKVTDDNESLIEIMLPNGVPAKGPDRQRLTIEPHKWTEVETNDATFALWKNGNNIGHVEVRNDRIVITGGNSEWEVMALP